MGIKLNGISVPIGGISWEYTESGQKGIQEMFYYLESKRLLINPKEMENKEWSEKSAIEIKNKLVDILSRYKYDQNIINVIQRQKIPSTGKCHIKRYCICNYFSERESGSGRRKTPTPETPGTTTKTSNPPKTGDTANAALWIAILVLSAAGITGVRIWNKKKQVKRLGIEEKKEEEE